jgi:hypothetical protein
VHATVLSAVQLDPEIALSPGAAQALIEHPAPPHCRAAALPPAREPDPAQEPDPAREPDPAQEEVSP